MYNIDKMCYSNETITRIMNRKKMSKNRAEAIAMSIFEYDEEKHMRNEREEGREEAFDLMQKLMEAGKNEDMKRVLTDREYREQLYREYHIFQ
ncbi:MAG: hypothetical protein HDR18_01240 [Lachnospiraceae bacterium]|nr:hypothetical protein [Lachnospiraceae bacterium]